MELHGLTGKMRFDNVTGNRNYFKVDVVKVHESKMHRLGSWDPEKKMTLTRTASEIYTEFSQSITNKTFVVVGKLVKMTESINQRLKIRYRLLKNKKIKMYSGSTVFDEMQRHGKRNGQRRRVFRRVRVRVIGGNGQV